MKSGRVNRIRKSTKYACIIIATIVFLFSINNLLGDKIKSSIKTTNKTIYQYTNKFNYDYDVKLLGNAYISQDELDNNFLVYVTDLIDTTTLNLNYEYDAEEKTKLDYEYSIKGVMNVVYTKDKKEELIWKEEDILVEKKDLSVNSNKINLEENIVLDLKERNALLKQFEQEMSISVDAKYCVILCVDIKTLADGEDIKNTYTSQINIDLAEKTTTISGENNINDTEYISTDVEEVVITENKDSNTMIVSVIGLIISVFLMKYALTAQTINRLRNEYREELNRILKLCQDKIVEVSSISDETQEKIVLVKDFDEIYKLSEELLKPILYYDNGDDNEAIFSVITENVVYRFVFKG